MKKAFCSLVALCLCLVAGAQTDFRHITFSEAKAAAKAENKLVFIDFCAANYTKLDSMQQVYLTQSYADLFAGESADTKKKAARFLRNQLPDMDLNNMYFTMMQISDLEGAGH